MAMPAHLAQLVDGAVHLLGLVADLGNHVHLLQARVQLLRGLGAVAAPRQQARVRRSHFRDDPVKRLGRHRCTRLLLLSYALGVLERGQHAIAGRPSHSTAALPRSRERWRAQGAATGLL